MNNFEFQKLINATLESEQKSQDREELVKEKAEKTSTNDQEENKEDSFKARGNTAEITNQDK